jgi:hypothetical protein
MINAEDYTTFLGKEIFCKKEFPEMFSHWGLIYFIDFDLKFGI